MKEEIVVILLEIRSSENVGSIFRTSDAAGVSKLYLCGYTPTPFDRFGRKNTKLVKASLGAEDFVEWEGGKEIFSLLKELKSDGFSIVAVEQSASSISYTDLKKRGKTAFIFGNEVEGIPENVLNKADTVIHVPMKGKKESLNVSVCAGVILFDSVRPL